MKLLCERTVARRWAEEHGESVAALKERLRVSNSGAAYFLQKRLDETLDAEAEGAADQAAQVIHDAPRTVRSSPGCCRCRSGTPPETR